VLFRSVTIRRGLWRLAVIAAFAGGASLAPALAPVHAQSAEPQPLDAGRDTIFVTAPRTERFGPVSETHRALTSDDVEALRARDAAAVVRRLPSAHVPTNSRGEALIYLRSAGERQVAAFFDGALLNVPWDNRYDLSLVPASVINTVTSASGTLSPQYGVNALGAVAFFPISPSDTPNPVSVNVETGGEHYVGASATVTAPLGRLDTLVSINNHIAAGLQGNPG